MFIPKNKMMVLIGIIDAGMQTIGNVLTDDEKELINQIADKAALVHNGDANFLEVEVCYANNPKR